MTVPFPLSTYTARLDAVAALLGQQHIDAAVLTPGADLRFLLASDIDTHERFSALVITPTTRRIVVPAVDAGALRDGIAGQAGVQVVPWTDGQDALELAVGDLHRHAADATVAVSGEMPANHLLNLQARGLRTVNATAVLRDVFMVKDASEIAELRRAGAAIDEVHRQVPGLLRAGRTEREVAGDLEKLILAGHVAVDFIIVGSGPHGADPHHDYSDRILEEGDIVVIDIGGTLDSGYHSDCTRTYIVGPVDAARPDQAEAYRVLRRAQQAGLCLEFSRVLFRSALSYPHLNVYKRRTASCAGHSRPGWTPRSPASPPVHWTRSSATSSSTPATAGSTPTAPATASACQVMRNRSSSPAMNSHWRRA